MTAWNIQSRPSSPVGLCFHASIDLREKKTEWRCGTPSFCRNATVSVLWHVWTTSFGPNASRRPSYFSR